MVTKSLEKSQTSDGPARLCHQVNSSLQEKVSMVDIQIVRKCEQEVFITCIIRN